MSINEAGTYIKGRASIQTIKNTTKILLPLQKQIPSWYP